MGRGSEGYVLGVDLGTTFTAAAIARGEAVEVVMLSASGATVPSAVAIGESDEIIVGEAAEVRGVSNPTLVARQFKRRFGDSAPIMVGSSMRSAQALTADLLRWVLELVTEREGAPPEMVVVTHPANWKSFKLELLEGAIEQAGVAESAMLSEPVAAAIDYASRSTVAASDLIAVYDLGGGTFDSTILERSATGFETLGEARGIEHLGGIDFDAALTRFVLDQLPDGHEVDEDDPATATALGQLRQSVVQAKVALSSDTHAVVPVLLPGAMTEVRVTREDFEQLISRGVLDSIDALKRTLEGAGRSSEDLAAILLVGGSSRIPLVGRLVSQAMQRPVAVDTDPKLAIARGAAVHGSKLLAPGRLGPAPEPAEHPAHTTPTGSAGPAGPADQTAVLSTAAAQSHQTPPASVAQPGSTASSPPGPQAQGPRLHQSYPGNAPHQAPSTKPKKRRGALIAVLLVALLAAAGAAASFLVLGGDDDGEVAVESPSDQGEPQGESFGADPAPTAGAEPTAEPEDTDSTNSTDGAGATGPVLGQAQVGRVSQEDTSCGDLFGVGSLSWLVEVPIVEGEATTTLADFGGGFEDASGYSEITGRTARYVLCGIAGTSLVLAVEDAQGNRSEPLTVTYPEAPGESPVPLASTVRYDHDDSSCSDQDPNLGNYLVEIHYVDPDGDFATARAITPDRTQDLNYIAVSGDGGTGTLAVATCGTAYEATPFAMALLDAAGNRSLNFEAINPEKFAGLGDGPVVNGPITVARHPERDSDCAVSNGGQGVVVTVPYAGSDPVQAWIFIEEWVDVTGGDAQVGPDTVDYAMCSSPGSSFELSIDPPGEGYENVTVSFP